MGEIINISDNYKLSSDYQDMLKEVIEQLEEMEERLSLMIVNVATSGVWKEWSDLISNGEYFYFGQEALRDTGDENVNCIFLLMDEVVLSREKIQRQIR